MRLDDYLADPNVRAFLRVIRAGESNQNDSAYTIRFGGSHFGAPPWQHPGRVPITANGYTSTAAGAFQFLYSTWTELAKKWDFPDFSPESQELGAVALLLQCGAMPFVVSGDLKAACDKAGRIWASLPGSPYNQPTITLQRVEQVFRQYGGMPNNVPRESNSGLSEPQSPTPEPQRKKPMAAPLLLALAPMLAELIPQVAKLFSSGSEVATRNVAAVEAVARTVVTATNSANVQEAIERMQANPELTQQVQQAVVTDPTIIGLLEVGGGIARAQQNDLAAQNAERPFFYSPAFWIFLTLCPLLYMVVGSVVLGWSDQEWSDEMKSVVVTAIVTGLLGAITGYYFGSSYGSQKKTEALTKP